MALLPNGLAWGCFARSALQPRALEATSGAPPLSRGREFSLNLFTSPPPSLSLLAMHQDLATASGGGGGSSRRNFPNRNLMAAKVKI